MAQENQPTAEPSNLSSSMLGVGGTPEELVICGLLVSPCYLTLPTEDHVQICILYLDMHTLPWDTYQPRSLLPQQP